MNGIKLAFDTCAVINLIDQRCDLHSQGINVDEAQLLTSVIVRMELLSKRNMTDGEKQDILKFLDALMVVPLNDAIEQKAIDVRSTTSLKLPDSIIVATAIVLDAILLTDDTELLALSLPGLRTQKVF